MLWTASALPSVVTLTAVPDGLEASKFHLSVDESLLLPIAQPETLIELQGAALRVALYGTIGTAPAVLLPLDRFFDIRTNSALRLWRALTGRDPGPNPATLSRARRERLLLALRALDGRLDKASYREIAEVLFALGRITSRAWQTHDLRDRTIRLVRYGFDLMEGGYRRLLLHPYRGRR